MDLLVVLAEQPGATLSKRALLERVWGGAAIEDGCVALCVSELRAAFGDDARQARYIRTVHRRGYCLIAPVAAIGPPASAQRIQPPPGSVRSPSPSLPSPSPPSPPSPSPPSSSPSPPSPSPSPRAVLAAATILIVTLLVLVHRWRTETRSDAALPRGVVVGLSNLGGAPDDAWIGPAAAQLLTAELASTEAFRLVPFDLATRALHALPVARVPSDLPSGSDVVALAERLGVRYVFGGHFLRPDGASDTLRLDFVVTDAASGEVVVAAVERGEPARLESMVTLAAIRLVEALEDTDVRVRAAAPPGPGGPDLGLPRAYFEAEAFVARHDFRPARERFEAAVDAAPDAPWPRLGLAEVWSRLGHDRRAAAMVRRAEDLAVSLRGEERLWFAARSLLVAGDRDGAVARLEALTLLEPDSFEYRVALISALIEAARAEEAGRALAIAAARFGVMAEEEPRLRLAFAEVALAESDPARALRHARTAADLARRRGAPWIEGSAFALEARAHHAAGATVDAMERLALARERFAVLGDRARGARLRMIAAGWHAARGAKAQAIEAVREALAICRSIGDRRCETDALADLGFWQWQRDHDDRGETLLASALALARERGDRAAEARVRRRIGIGSASFGRGPPRPHFEAALAIWRELGNRREVRSSLMNLGRLALLAGDFETAHERYEEARTVVESLEPRDAALIDFNLGYAEQVTGRLADAAESFGRAFATFHELDDRGMVAAALEARSATALLRGRVSAAVAWARASLALRERGEDRQQTIRARAVLARSLRAAGHRADAEQLIAQAESELGARPAPSVREVVKQVAADLALDRGDLDAAFAAIEQLGGGRDHWPTISTAARRITEARALAAAGDVDSARELLVRLESHFARHGAEVMRIDAALHRLEIARSSGEAVRLPALDSMRAGIEDLGLALYRPRLAALANRPASSAARNQAAERIASNASRPVQ